MNPHEDTKTRATTGAVQRLDRIAVNWMPKTGRLINCSILGLWLSEFGTGRIGSSAAGVV
jgi:hypothetical protein